MIKPWLVRRAFRHQLANLRKLADGEPLCAASLGGMTLDLDDVQIARASLRDPSGWGDVEPVLRFQEDFARWNGSRHAFAFMSGRVALSACLDALGLQQGDEVILPGYTCVVVPNALNFAGITPVYCDIELDTYGPDVASVEAVITPRTRAILLHHLYGLVCRDYEGLLELAQRHGLAVIEDCAHATGAEYRGVRVGNRGTLAFYSSEQSKVFNTIQGGVAVTNDDALASRLRDFWERCPEPTSCRIESLLRTLVIQYYSVKHPQRWWLGDIMEIAHGAPELISTTPDEMRGQRPPDYGCRMGTPIALLASNQLQKLNAYNRRRRETARLWDEWCLGHEYAPAKVLPNSSPVYLRYPVMVAPERKQDVSWGRRELNVDVGVWFRGSLHPLDGCLPGLPGAAKAVASCINLPCLLP